MRVTRQKRTMTKVELPLLALPEIPRVRRADSGLPVSFCTTVGDLRGNLRGNAVAARNVKRLWTCVTIGLQTGRVRRQPVP